MKERESEREQKKQERVWNKGLFRLVRGKDKESQSADGTQ